MCIYNLAQYLTIKILDIYSTFTIKVQKRKFSCRPMYKNAKTAKNVYVYSCILTSLSRLWYIFTLECEYCVCSDSNVLAKLET